MKRIVIIVGLITLGFFLLKPSTKEYSDSALKALSVSNNGLQLVMGFESFKPKPYICPGGRLTIGYGSTRIHKRKVKPFDSITKPEATILLTKQLHTQCKVINNNVNTHLTQNQYDALCSLVYNIGPSAFKQSTLLKKINEDKFDEAANEFTKWDKIKRNGYLVSLDGLRTRRNKEKELFLS